MKNYILIFPWVFPRTLAHIAETIGNIPKTIGSWRCAVPHWIKALSRCYGNNLIGLHHLILLTVCGLQQKAVILIGAVVHYRLLHGAASICCFDAEPQLDR